jgi:TRIAD3 protein (E3 ubiquitin-protein ligase RNF216)
MATPGMNGREVVNIASDSDEDAFSDDDDVQFFDANHERQGPLSDFPRMDGMLDYNRVCETPNGIIDLTAIPDIDVPPSDPLLTNMEVPDSEGFNGDSELVTEAVGLQMVLDFLPDIAIDHVLNIIRERTTDLTRTMGKCQEIVVQLVEEGTYPKEEDEANNRKRKRNDEDDWKHYDTADRDPDITTYEVDA